MYNPYIAGKRIYLRHPTREDVAGRWHEWFSDQETMQWVPGHFWPNSVESQQAFYESIQNSRDRLVLSIVDIETDTHIGVCNLSSLNWRDRHADMAVIIGEKEYREGIYVTEVIAMLLKIAFNRLNFRIVKGGYLSCNEASKAILELFRFKEIGTYKEIIWFEDHYVDHVLVMLRREDWLRRNTATPTK